MILLANTTTINKNTHINKFQINSTTVDASSDALLRTTSSDGGAKTKKKKSKKRTTLRKKKKSATLKFNANKQEPKYNWAQELRVESQTVRCVSFTIPACVCVCVCAVTSRSFHAPHPTEFDVYTQSPYMREPASQTTGKNNKTQEVHKEENISPTSQEKDARYQLHASCQ